MNTKNICSGTGPEQFAMAVKLSDMASELDEHKTEFDASLAGQFLDCALAMHKMAELIAGDRAGEIYGEVEA